jgi:enoyl-CoA hydratase
LPRRAAPRRAAPRRALLPARPARLSATEALAAGLVSRVADDPLAEAAAIAEAVAAGTSRAAAAAAAAALRAAGELPLGAGLARERELFYSCFGQDQAEGMAAFMEKRPPAFGGRR